MLIPRVEELRRRRKAASLNQNQLAKRAELPCNAIYRIESGISKQTQLLRARAIAKALKCKVTDIFDDAK